MKKWQLIIIHLIFWAIFLLRDLPGKFNVETFKNEPLYWSFLFVNICAFYINYFVILPFIMKKNKISYFILGTISAFLTFIFLRYFVEEMIFPKFMGTRNYFEGTPFLFYMFDNLYYRSNSVFMSSLIWFLNFAVVKKRENEALLTEKNNAEISLLKSQINPHFIFNTLNNIYALVDMKSEKSLAAIEKLGDLLRISGSEIHKDFIPISTEIKYLESLIDLEILRLKSPEIIFKSEVENPDMKIAPMILIPFVENAFKHGDINNFPLNICIKTEGKDLVFNLKNKIRQGKKDHSTGIGIKNVRKRLELIYPKKHSLKITETDGLYEVNLKIKVQ